METRKPVKSGSDLVGIDIHIVEFLFVSFYFNLRVTNLIKSTKKVEWQGIIAGHLQSF